MATIIESSSFADLGFAPGVNSESGDVKRLLGLLRRELPTSEQANWIGKYFVLEILRDSSHTFVFKAVDTVLNREVVLKFYKPESSTEQDVVAEGRALSKTDNPHVIKAFGVEQVHGQNFLVLDNIDGVTLGEFRENKVLSEAHALELVVQILDGLAEVHRNGLLHLDLKPGNVMIEPTSFKATIIDFGLARRINEVSVDEIFGTRGFVAPERVKNQPGLVDQTTDIFGVGALLFFLLTGEAPLETDIAKIGSTTPTPRMQLLRCSGGVRRLIADCLAEDKSLRPQDCPNMLRRVRKIRSHKLIKASGLITIGITCCFCLAMIAMGFGQFNSTEPRISNDNRTIGSFVVPEDLISIDESELVRKTKVHERIRILRRTIDKSCRLAEFSYARKYQLRLHDFVKLRWPEAKDRHQVEHREFEMFDEFSKFELDEQREISKTYQAMFEAYDLSSGGKTTEAAEQMKLALDDCISKLGPEHGLTTIINSEWVQLKLNAGTVNDSEYHRAVLMLRDFYQAGSQREAELHHSMGINIQDGLLELSERKGQNIVTDFAIKKRTKAADVFFQNAIDVMGRYSMGHTDREIAYLLSAACFKRRFNDRKSSNELIKKAKTICQTEFGFRFNNGIRTLINIAEQQEFEHNFQESKATLGLAKRHASEEYLAKSVEFSPADTRLLELRQYCDMCDRAFERIGRKIQEEEK